MKCQNIRCQDEAKYAYTLYGNFKIPTVEVYLCERDYLNCFFIYEEDHKNRIIKNSKLAPSSL